MRHALAGLAGSAVFFTGTLYGYEMLAQSKPTDGAMPFDPARSMSCFSRNSARYDDSIDRDELFMGIKALRWYMMRTFVSGHTLELAVGTGRNLGYYDPSKVSKLTLADQNRDMLIEASSKVRGGQATRISDVTLCLADMENLAGTFAPESFDTVVDTFGLCSLSDPPKALEQMARVVRPGGSIVLIEHGRGTWRLVNDILDAQQANHFEKWGCHFNRDMEAMIEDLVAREFEVVWRWRTHFGTTCCWVLRKRE